MQAATATFFERQWAQKKAVTDAASGTFAAIEDGGGTSTPGSAHDLICTHDLQGRILDVNSGACEALGVSAGALRRMTIQELLSPHAAFRYEAYVARLERDGFADGIMQIVTSGGDKRTWEYRNTLQRSESRPPIVRGVAWDVTEREKAILIARSREEHFRSIIENVSDIIAIIEPDGRFRYGSPSVTRVLGYPRDTLLGRAGIELIHPDDIPRAVAFLSRQIADPLANESIELRFRHQDGTWLSFEIVATNVVKNGKISAVVTNARNVTERKHLESQLLQANRLGGLGRLAATVAHEFNNVLMGMQPFAELMQRPNASPEIIAKGAFHISNSIKRGRRIVLDILRFAQPHVPVTASLDLGEWWESFAPEAEAVLGNVISLVSAVPRRGIFVTADRAQLAQVLSNLVANARDAMPTGGVLTVTACEPGPNARFGFASLPHSERFVQISVRDTGHGMPAEVMERVFEPLFTTRESGGTGLGLAVAHQVMAQHGGHIFVESEPGHGSTFHLFLPKAKSRPEAPVCIAAPASVLAVRRVLVIDDEPPIVEGVTAFLEQEGIEVDTVGNGFEAAGAVDRFRPDVVLLDIGLPDMDGSEVYTLLRKLHPSLPIIFTTGHGDRRVLLDRLDDPCVRFLQKPFELSVLREVMAGLEIGVTP